MTNAPETATPPNILYCANHPDVETSLRCNRCEKPICIKCAVLTPTGYRCRECVRGQQKVFDNAQWFDYPLGFAIVAFLSFLGSMLAPVMGFLTIFLAPLAGGVIAEAVRFVVRRRRSRLLFSLMAVACVVGGAPVLLVNLFRVLAVTAIGGGGLGSFMILVWCGLYVVLSTSTLYYRMVGINVKY